MASKNLTFDIFGRDKTASKAIKGVGKTAEGVTGIFAKLGGAVVAALAVKSVVDFGTDSVAAFSEAQASQAKLADAFTRFPALADTSTKKLGDLNSALAKKTKFDDDATTSGQAVLAGFGLTGKQIEKLTPLLQDYAAKTGKDLPSAAQDLGKAVLGQGKALKGIGIQFKDTGSEAGNFESLVGSLSAKVGGFAEKEGTTAAGKMEILKNRFGEVQEAIGAALLPILEDLGSFIETDVMPVVEDFSAWFTETGGPAIKDFGNFLKENKDTLLGFAAAIGAGALAFALITGALALFNAVMAISPLTWIILGIAALTAGIVWVATQTTFFQDTWKNMCDFIGTAINWVWLSVIKPVMGWLSGAFTVVGTTAGIVFSVIGDVIAGAFNGALSIVKGIVNTIIGLVNTVIGNINGIGSAIKDATGGAVDIHIGKIPMLATGGTIAKSGWAVVGEKGPEMVKLPTGSSVYANGTGPRMGSTFIINQVSDPIGTAHAVARRQNMLAAV